MTDLFNLFQRLKKKKDTTTADECSDGDKLADSVEAQLASIVSQIFRHTHSCDSHDCVDIRARPKCSVTFSRVPSLRA